MTDQKTYFGNFLISQNADASSSLPRREYDLVLTFVSWEERCLSILNSNISSSVIIIFKFKTDEVSLERDENSKKFSAWAMSSDDIEDYKRIELSYSTDSQFNFTEIASEISSLQNKLGRQLRVLADASSCPKSIASFLIGFGFGHGAFKQLDFFYAHSDYNSKTMKGNKDTNSEDPSAFYRFTDGSWSPILIPYLEGNFRATAPRSLIVAVGAETYATEAFLKRYQPEKLQFILPSPSVTNMMDESLTTEVNRLIERMELKPSDVSKVAPYDMISAALKVDGILKMSNDKYDQVVACVGTKPHAIGSAIAAFLNPNAALVCRVPNKYLEIPGKSNGQASLFSIEDLSAF